MDSGTHPADFDRHEGEIDALAKWLCSQWGAAPDDTVLFPARGTREPIWTAFRETAALLLRRGSRHGAG